MYAAGQNQVSGHNITLWNANAFVGGGVNPVATIPLTGPNPPNGQNQRTILIGDTGVPERDFTAEFSPYIETGAPMGLIPAGAACFEAIPVDCVSWGGGAFVGAGNLPDKSTPFGQPLPTTFAIRRSITAGCSTLLEAADDTNNNADDFQPAVPRAPTNNATAPTEQSCENAGVGGIPSLRCRGKEATLRGTAGKDNLEGTPGRDVIVVGGGNDRVNGRGGKDLICGEDGKDVLIGGPGKDTLVGGAGADRLLGGGAKDKLLGQGGRDVCNGGAGSDSGKSCERPRRL